MRGLFVINTLYGQAWYEFFYFTSIFLAGVWFMWSGRERRYPMDKWSLIYVAGITFFIFGTKFLPLGVEEWLIFFDAGQVNHAPPRSVLGGILFGIFGFWLARAALRFPYSVLDSLAIAFPAAMAVQRLGCLAAGCCYGTPTNMPWAVMYGVDTPAFQDQMAAGFINAGACISPGLHPTQLYQALLCMGIAVIVWRLRQHFHRPGSLFYFSIGLYLVGRFFIEFWNSPEAGWLDASIYPGLKNTQWILLGGIIYLTARIILARRPVEASQERAHQGVPTIIVFLVLVGVVLWISPRLNPIEFLVIQAMFLNAWFYQLRAWFAHAGQTQKIWTSAAFLLSIGFVFGGILTAQKNYAERTQNAKDRNTFFEIMGGYGQLTYHHYHEAPSSSQGCNGGTVYTPNGPIFRQKEQVFGAGFKAIHTRGEFEKVEYSGTVSGGRDKDVDDVANSSIGTFDLGGSIKVDRRWFGLGFGLHTGSAMHDERRSDILYTTDHDSQWYLGLSGSIRLFPYDIVYCEFRYNELMPYQIMGRANTLSQFLVGTGFGLKNGSALEFGKDIRGGFFIGGKAIVNNTYGIRGTLYARRAARDSWHLADIGLTYRFTK